MGLFSKKKEEKISTLAPTVIERITGLVDALESFEQDRVQALEVLTGEKAKSEASLTETIKERNAEIEELDGKIAKLKLKRKLDEEDLAHMIKMKEDRLQLEYDRKLMEAKKEHQDEIAELKASHNEEIKTELKKQSDQTLKMYSQILERLPNLNATLKIKSDGS